MLWFSESPNNSYFYYTEMRHNVTLTKLICLFRVLTKQARVECQSHKLTVEDPVTLEYITRYDYMSVFN